MNILNDKNHCLPKNSREIKILHAPSNLEAKGTLLIRKAINTLIDEGYDIKYTELTGVLNTEVLNKLRHVDLVIDELYSDTPMAVFASEAASFGVPVIVGGYGWQNLKRIYGDDLPPAFTIEPEQLKAFLKLLLNHRKQIKEKGGLAKQYVTQKWNISVIANKFNKIICDDIPEDWFFNPDEIDYIYGMGISKKRLKENLTLILNNNNIDVLCLQNNPLLEQSLLRFCQN